MSDWAPPNDIERPVQPVIVQAQPVFVPKRTAHGFHLTMCVLTCGLWLPVYGLCALLNAGKTKRVA